MLIKIFKQNKYKNLFKFQSSCNIVLKILSTTYGLNLRYCGESSLLNC